MAGERWCACGDAAASFDPLSSQGLSTALGSGIEAAAQVASVLRHGSPSSPSLDDAKDPWLMYITNRNAYYSLERRWPDSPFWRRRQTDQRLVPVEGRHVEPH
jgi:flavin-dependent dehydrogenase